MPSSLPKKSAKRAVKKTMSDVPAVGSKEAARILEMRTLPDHKRHGLATAVLILVFLTLGCLAAATLMSEKVNTVVGYAQGLAARLGAAQQQNADLRGQLADIKTMQELATKVMAPPVVPSSLVWNTYTSPNLSLQYPDGYTVVKATNSFPALTIKGDQGRIEIFRMKDFPGGDRSFGLANINVGQSDLDQNIPKEFKSAAPDPSVPNGQPYSVWVYYGTGDAATKAVLDQMVGSIKVVK